MQILSIACKGRVFLKKLLLVLLIVVFSVATNFNKVQAEETKDISSILKGIDEVKIIEDNEEKVTVTGREKNTIVTITYDKNTSDVTMISEELNLNTKKILTEENNFNIQIDQNDLENFEIDSTIEYQGKNYDLEKTPNFSEYKQARFAVAVPLAVALGESVIIWIITQFASIVIAGVTYVLATGIIEKIKNKQYDHYQAELKDNNLYIGNSITFETATARLLSSDVWSKTSSLAAKVARAAGKNKAPVGSENHAATGSKKGLYYNHYHTYNRKGGHSFYGSGIRGKK